MVTVRRKGTLVGSKGQRAECDVTLNVQVDHDGNETETFHSFEVSNLTRPLPDDTLHAVNRG